MQFLGDAEGYFLSQRLNDIVTDHGEAGRRLKTFGAASTISESVVLGRFGSELFGAQAIGGLAGGLADNQFWLDHSFATERIASLS